MELPPLRLSIPKDHADATNQLNRIFGKLDSYLRAIPATAITPVAGTPSPFDTPPFPTTAAGSTAVSASGVSAGTGISVTGPPTNPMVSNTGVVSLVGQGVVVSSGAATIAQQAQRVTTGSIALSTTTPVTLTWASAFADANYTPQASVVDASGFLQVLQIVSFSATQVVVNVRNTDAGGAHTGTLCVLALHD